jgi:hypothetical protein
MKKCGTAKPMGAKMMKGAKKMAKGSDKMKGKAMKPVKGSKY